MLKIRPLEPNDAKRVTTLTKQLGYDTSLEDISKNILLFLDHPYGKVFIAEIQGHVVGYICIWIREHFHDTRRAARIMALVVDHEHRRSGIGKQLLDFIETYARTIGCSSLDLTSSYHRTEAHRFYENLGYLPEPTRYFSKKID